MECIRMHLFWTKSKLKLHFFRSSLTCRPLYCQLIVMFKQKVPIKCQAYKELLLKGHPNVYRSLSKHPTWRAMVLVSDPLGVAAMLGAFTAMKVPFRETWCDTMRQLPLPLLPE